MAAAPQGEDVYATVSAPNHRGTTVQSTDPSKLLLNDLYLPGTFLPTQLSWLMLTGASPQVHWCWHTR
jgi:hypothetical protein